MSPSFILTKLLAMTELELNIDKSVLDLTSPEPPPQHQDEHNVCPLDIKEARAVWAPSEHPPGGGVTHY